MTDPKTNFLDNDYKTPPIVPPKSRASEPSTWSGIAAIILGVLFARDHPELVAPEFVGGVVAVIAGIAGVFLHEGKR
jgi:hypothetical protein